MRLSAPLIGVVLFMVACVALVGWAIIDYATPEVPTATPTAEVTEEPTPTSTPTPELASVDSPVPTMEDEQTEESPMATPAPTEEAAEEMQVEVVMRNTRFQPQEISVQPGTSVVWTNEDEFGHTVTAGTRDNPSGLFDSGNVPSGGSFEFTFAEPGTYEYFCSFHSGMRGTIVVEE